MKMHEVKKGHLATTNWEDLTEQNKKIRAENFQAFFMYLFNIYFYHRHQLHEIMKLNWILLLNDNNFLFSFIF